ncbi:peflin [Metarhizium rileyi]|uniref:Peflin n=1 Tax=Metarhizium rileyi (strain RCEF 4871) TaxID=1649241 RepID=A0A162JIX0_METRR|nr:peflin [Metarhizium rileyi RCEF 4871]
MAYNRPNDPDALPRFAEPEQKQGFAPSQTSQQSHYGRNPQSASPRDKYHSPPPQPIHGQTFHSGSGSGSGSGSHGPRPASQPPSRPPPQQSHSAPPPTPDAASGTNPTLLPLFRAVDKDRTGQLSEKELSAALVNGDWTAFDIQTIRMMIRMFDTDRNGTINFEEFCGLWSFLASWRTLFDRFDIDRSGNISLQEFTDALIAFRYRLSPHFVSLLFRTYDKRNEGVMSFDLFVQSCISLKRMTDVFKKYDDDRDGYITLSFEDFLSEILKQLR